MPEVCIKNIKIVLEYDGTNFCGWQKQPKVKTVEGEISQVLETLLSVSPEIIVAGRTDSGVHALGQVANFSSVSEMTPLEIKNALNSLMSNDVRIIEADEVPLAFNARYDAKWRTYRYEITSRPTSIWRKLRWYVKWSLDGNAMREAAGYLVGEHSFSAFTYKDEVRNPWINLREIEVAEIEPKGFAMTFVANRFLRKMVRMLAGTLVEVGRGRLMPEEARGILESGDRTRAGPCTPPHGLYLVRVEY